MNAYRRLACLVASVITLGFVRGEAPASLSGRIFYQSGTTATVGLRAYGASAYLLDPDGHYTELYSLGWDITRAIGGWQPPSGGTYEYTRTGTDSGILTLQPMGFARAQKRLAFASDRHGNIVPNPLVIQNFTFWLGDPSTPAPLANAALRAFVRSGAPAIAGFVITGAHQRAVLVRAVGPGLESFGVTRFLADPRISIPKLGPPIDANDNWHAGNAAESIRRAEALTGAFPLTSDSADAALILPGMSPGAYTVLAEGADGAAEGEVLIEVYLLP